MVVRTNDDLQMGVVKPTGPSRPSLWTRALSEDRGIRAPRSRALYIGFAVSQFVSAYAIPSRSMDETLKVGDVVLAEKASSRLGLPLQHGDLVFFAPPAEPRTSSAVRASRAGSAVATSLSSESLRSEATRCSSMPAGEASW